MVAHLAGVVVDVGVVGVVVVAVVVVVVGAAASVVPPSEGFDSPMLVV